MDAAIALADDYVPLVPHIAWCGNIKFTDAWVSWYDNGQGRLQPVKSKPFVDDIYIHWTVLEQCKIETLNKQNRVAVAWIDTRKGPRAILVEVL